MPPPPFGRNFGTFDDFSAVFLFVFVLGAYFSDIVRFWGPFGVQFRKLCGVPGNLENNLEKTKGVRFSHFGALFCRHDFQARFSE